MFYKKIIYISLVFFVLGTVNSISQTYIYEGRYANTDNILYTFDGKHIYKGRYTNTDNILYTFDGNFIYKGRYTNTDNILYTSDRKYIYKGRYKNTDQIILNISGYINIAVIISVLF
jgi:hypothetical protein